MPVIQLSELIDKLKTQREGKKVVFTNGCFDILHVGHTRYLAEARSQGDILVVGLNSDSSVQALKGPERPLQIEAERGEILSQLQSVDYVVIFSEETPKGLIEAVQPDVLVKGGDWAIKDIVGSDFVLKQGGEVKSLQFVAGRSTSNLVDKIKKL